jgi:hypothetical protein
LAQAAQDQQVGFPAQTAVHLLLAQYHLPLAVAVVALTVQQHLKLDAMAAQAAVRVLLHTTRLFRAAQP